MIRHKLLLAALHNMVNKETLTLSFTIALPSILHQHIIIAIEAHAHYNTSDVEVF